MAATVIMPHFPILRMSEAGRQWFNPVQKIRVADRPEERVRLRMIEFLVREAGFSLNRMTTESGVKLQSSEHPGRTDILCFDELLRPLLLVECKSESVKLDEKAAMQAARYNLSVKAPYLMLTNGVQDLLFAVREDGQVEHIPDFWQVFTRIEEPVRTIDYWQERGMWGTVADHEKDAVATLLHHFWRMPEVDFSEEGVRLQGEEARDSAWNRALQRRTVQYVQLKAPPEIREFLYGAEGAGTGRNTMESDNRSEGAGVEPFDYSKKPEVLSFFAQVFASKEGPVRGNTAELEREGRTADAGSGYKSEIKTGSERHALGFVIGSEGTSCALMVSTTGSGTLRWAALKTETVRLVNDGRRAASGRNDKKPVQVQDDLLRARIQLEGTWCVKEQRRGESGSELAEAADVPSGYGEGGKDAELAGINDRYRRKAGEVWGLVDLYRMMRG